MRSSGAIELELPAAALTVAQSVRSGGGRALLVGGCVRDALLGRKPGDFDFECFGLSGEKPLPMFEYVLVLTPSIVTPTFSLRALPKLGTIPNTPIEPVRVNLSATIASAGAEM